MAYTGPGRDPLTAGSNAVTDPACKDNQFI